VFVQEQYKAHIDQLNTIIEDLQQRLLDQEMETEACRAAALQPQDPTSLTAPQVFIYSA
jgi:hypothetical protein